MRTQKEPPVVSRGKLDKLDRLSLHQYYYYYSTTMAAEVPAERVLCFNVLVDETRRDSGIFRHPLYQYSEDLAWPPANWRKIACWLCCHVAAGEPVPLPQSHDRNSGNFSVFGVFCSWPCAKQYLNESQGWCSGERALLLEDLAREGFGYTGPMIRAAPPRHRLEMFGGDLTIEEFRKEHHFFNGSLRPPLVSFPEIYERANSSNHQDNTAPPQWGIRGLRCPLSKDPAGKQAPNTIEGDGDSEIQQSPFDKYLSTRKTPRVPRAEAQEAAELPGTLQRYLKSK